MKFRRLAEFLERLEQTSSRNEITKILAELFAESSSAEVGRVCYLALGELLPAYRGVEFNLAEKMMFRVLGEVFAKTKEEAKALFQQTGDLGDVAYTIAKRRKITNTKLSVEEVYDRLMEVTEDSGEGSQERKVKKMAQLLGALDPLSARFVARIPVGKLRLGFSDVTVLDALSVMERGDKSARKEIERAYNVTADIGDICTRVKKGGLKSLTKLSVRLGVPIRPSLADRIPGVKEVIKKLGPEVAIEPKLDGFRTGIHIWSEGEERRVALFSRNLENTTAMFPEIVEAARSLPCRSVILDGETIGFNPKTGKFAPFQETVQRKRKHGVAEMAKKIPLKIFVFDILYLDGRSLLSLSFRERREILERVAKNFRGALKLTEQKMTDKAAVIEEEFKKSLAAGLEGLVAKKLNSVYEAGGRGFHWVKLKATTQALERARTGRGILDTIDCVVMGGFFGKGKRVGFGFGGFLLGVRDKDGMFYTISKLGTGLSDEQFKEISKRMKKLKSKIKPKEYVVASESEPDVWIRPGLVVEVLADEITLSSRHTAGRGYSLRFPRLVRFRDDKNPEDTTAVAEVGKLYLTQERHRR